MKKYLFVFLFLLGISPTLAFAQSLGAVQGTIEVGKVLGAGLPENPSGYWQVGTVSNPSVVSVTLNGQQVNLLGLSQGQATVQVCSDTQNTNCYNISVNVTKPSVLGSFVSAGSPSKSWVISGKTIYYVTDQGLIPVPTWKIFVKNGGKKALIKQAVEADLTLPMLPLMTLKDSRVK